MKEARPPSRPLATWYLVALGVVCAVGLSAMLLAAIVNPTEQILTALATGLIPPVVLGAAAAISARRKRRC